MTDPPPQSQGRGERLAGRRVAPCPLGHTCLEVPIGGPPPGTAAVQTSLSTASGHKLWTLWGRTGHGLCACLPWGLGLRYYM